MARWKPAGDQLHNSSECDHCATTSREALKPLVAEWDRCWPEVTRTREILVLAEEFGAG